MDQQQQQQQMSSMYPTIGLSMDPSYPSTAGQFNINEIKKYQFPDCIISYFNYFEMWTQNLNGEQKKMQLNRLLQEDEIAFSIFMQNVNDPYEQIKAKLIEQLTECDESFLKNKTEKKKRKKMFRKMNKEEMQSYIRSTYNNLNALPKEKLVLNELCRSLPKKYKRMNLESKCTTVDQMIEVLGEKFSHIKLKEKDPARKRDPTKKKHGGHRSSSTSTSSSSSDDEKCKKKGHHEKGHHKKHW